MRLSDFTQHSTATLRQEEMKQFLVPPLRSPCSATKGAHVASRKLAIVTTKQTSLSTTAPHTHWLSSQALSFRTPEINHKRQESITHNSTACSSFGQENLLVLQAPHSAHRAPLPPGCKGLQADTAPPGALPTAGRSLRCLHCCQ